MRVLITGAAGFIGSHVAEKLLVRGDDVFAADNFDPFYSRVVKERNLVRALECQAFRFFEVDIRSKSAVASLIAYARPDAVVHLAAKAGVRPSIQTPTEYMETNVLGTLNLLQACSDTSVGHFVFASSSSVYGDTTRIPFRETYDVSRPSSPYAASKAAGEGLCYTYHWLTGIPMTCLRFFTVYGPRQRPDLAIHKFLNLMVRGEPIPFYGDGSTSRDYTYVSDIVEGVIAAIDRPHGYEIYNLGHHQPITLASMVSTLERCTGWPALIDPLPEQTGDVRMTYADISKAQRQLGYRPRVAFEEGVREFVSWWEEARNWARVASIETSPLCASLS